MSKEKETDRELDESFIQEIRELARKGEKAKKEEDQQLEIEPQDEDDLELEDMIAESVLEETQNPDEAHSLYYSIRESMKAHLPRGEQFKDLRDQVYEEKNIYINRGNKKDEAGIRGSDGRMSYLHHLRVALRIVKEWATKSSNSWDLYCVFRKLNEKLGYHNKNFFSDEEFDNEISDMFGNAWKYHNAIE
mgnify:CR=1 FL=1